MQIKLHYYHHHWKQTRKKEKKNGYPFLLWLVPDDATLFSDLVSDSSLRSRSCKLESLTQKRNLNGKWTLADILFKGDKKTTVSSLFMQVLLMWFWIYATWYKGIFVVFVYQLQVMWQEMVTWEWDFSVVSYMFWHLWQIIISMEKSCSTDIFLFKQGS